VHLYICRYFKIYYNKLYFNLIFLVYQGFPNFLHKDADQSSASAAFLFVNYIYKTTSILELAGSIINSDKLVGRIDEI
jgi:hypothetical protein